MRRFEIVDGSRRGQPACAVLNWDDSATDDSAAVDSLQGGPSRENFLQDDSAAVGLSTANSAQDDSAAVGPSTVNSAQDDSTRAFSEQPNKLSIDINKQSTVLDVPMMFAPFVRAGKRHINNKWSQRWVQERVVPTSRQNLGDVLQSNNLSHYDPMKLLVAGAGKCSQDDFFIREITGVPDETTAETSAEKSTETPAETSAEVATAIPAEPPKKSAAQHVGLMIKNARNKAGLSQVELAHAAKITQPALSNLERGRANPTIELLEDIADALGKKLDIRLA